MKVKPEIKARIIHAANTLMAEGIQNPTNDQVRDRLGGGSLSHISPVMREWRESRQSEVAAALEMPGDLKKAIETSLSQVWVTASRLASVAVETVREEAADKLNAVNHERDEALAEITRLEGKLSEMENRLQAEETQRKQAQQELQSARERNSALEAAQAALKAREEQQEAQVKGLKDELQAAREDNKKMQADLMEIARSMAAASQKKDTKPG